MRGQFPDAVDGAAVQSGSRVVRLRLESDAHVFDRAGYDGVGDAGKGAGGEVLAV